MPFAQSIPHHFQIAAVAAYAPPKSGICGISNAREWIYIGETDNIYAALMAHLQESETPLTKREPTEFVFEVCERLHRSDRQNRLIFEYEPVCNRR
jgi:hypothetical protein